MRILVFEFMVGGGVADQHPLGAAMQSFYQQGHAMLKTVCEDLLLLGHEVVTLVDLNVKSSLPRDVVQVSVLHESELDPTLVGVAEAADRILLIAPESDGCLEHFANLLSNYAGKFIGPDIEFIGLAADKWKCHQWLLSRNVPSPETTLVSEDRRANLPADFFPCVAKPFDGAGSEEVRVVSSITELGDISKPTLLQRFVAGVPASVSVIAETIDTVHFLEPGRQIFDTEPIGAHVRTEFPLEPSLRERAMELAKRTVFACPRTIGYFGIDMVLAEDPFDDVVIEINPRLTTSYCYLRDWSGENLAKKFPMLAGN